MSLMDTITTRKVPCRESNMACIRLHNKPDEIPPRGLLHEFVEKHEFMRVNMFRWYLASSSWRGFYRCLALRVFGKSYTSG